MQTQFTISTFWDKRAMNPKTKEGRVMLLVNLNRKQFCLSIKTNCTHEDYLKAMNGRMLTDNQKLIRNKIASFVMKAEALLSKLNDPTKESFIKFFKSDVNLSDSTKVDAYVLFQLKYDVLMREERFGTAKNLKNSLNSFKTFRSELFLEDIDESFLKNYRDSMLKAKRSTTTIGMYLRNLKAIYNQAIEDGLISGSLKPFKNIQMGSKIKSKSVLYPAQLKQLWDYRSESIRETRAIAFFFFSYLCNGMNFKDIGHLKYKNINGEILSFTREKTKRTRNNDVEIRIYLSDAIKKIIDVWGNKNKDPEQYIFQLMPKYKSIIHFEDTITRYKRTSNKSLTKIGKKLGFEVHLCLGLARHSFATKSKLAGIPISFISESMGHASIQTTTHYLKSLPDNMLKDANKHLLNFNG